MAKIRATSHSDLPTWWADAPSAENKIRPAARDLATLIGRPGGYVNIAYHVWESTVPRSYAFESWFSDLFQCPENAIETFLVRCGYEQAYAKFLAGTFISLGKKWAEEKNTIEKPLASLIRKIAKMSGQRVPPISRLAERIIPLLGYSTSKRLIDETLSRVGQPLNFENFRVVIQDAAKGDRELCLRLVEISRALAPYMPDPRGRNTTVATGVHAFFLQELHLARFKICYTCDPNQSTFSDPATRATRDALGLKSFHPRRARKLAWSHAF